MENKRKGTEESKRKTIGQGQKGERNTDEIKKTVFQGWPSVQTEDLSVADLPST